MKQNSKEQLKDSCFCREGVNEASPDGEEADWAPLNHSWSTASRLQVESKETQVETGKL